MASIPLEREDELAQRDSVDRGPSPNSSQPLVAAQAGIEKGGENIDVGPAVRFASVNQEIEPAYSLQADSTRSNEGLRANESMTPEAQAELRNLSKTLQEVHLQHRRTSNFGFEPVSLPVSRVPSNESSPQPASREATRSSRPSSRHSPATSSMHTPPLTPADSATRETGASVADTNRPNPFGTQITPQISDPQPSPGGGTTLPSTTTSTATSVFSSSNRVSTGSSTVSQEGRKSTDALPQRVPRFNSTSGGSSSLPQSRDQSPSGSGRLNLDAVPPPVSYSRPFTPVGDVNDPYSRGKREPQRRDPKGIESRFIFTGLDQRKGSRSGNSTHIPRASSHGDLKGHHAKHASASLQGAKKENEGGRAGEVAAALGHGHKQQGSMSDLKRFFKLGSHHKDKRPHPPARGASGKGGVQGHPSHQVLPSTVPFADDHGLQTKWGKFGKILGQGAGGSVRLMKRSSDGVTFAVKQFRDRHNYETERDYAKKVTAEFCIGSTLHHGNIIETLDIVHEKDHWYEVMEFAPYDLFAIVMTGKMSREEITCSFLQIFAGVTYLHSMGLAHRDLKLDNVVVNSQGIMKLIDFGSATVFRYPFENDIVPATGVVGSDPYLAPEVYDTSRYDPQPTDIWSLAIIYACMSLRRFPWKAPRVSDNSYKLFIATPTPGTPSADGWTRRSSERPKTVYDVSGPNKPPPSSEPATHQKTDDSKHSHHHHHHHSHKDSRQASETSLPDEERRDSEPQKSPTIATASTISVGTAAARDKQEQIRGSWRLLRLLPRESRFIMGRMLDTNPKTRATLEEMLQDPWINETPICSQGEGGKVYHASGHEHTLEPGAPVSPVTTKK